MSDRFSDFLMQLLRQSPMLDALILGIIVAIIFWKRSPPAAILTMIGSGTLLFTAIASRLAYQMLGRTAAEYRWNSNQVQTAYLSVNLIDSCHFAIGFGLLVTAVFTGRTAHNKPRMP